MTNLQEHSTRQHKRVFDKSTDIIQSTYFLCQSLYSMCQMRKMNVWANPFSGPRFSLYHRFGWEYIYISNAGLELDVAEKDESNNIRDIVEIYDFVNIRSILISTYYLYLSILIL